METEFNYNILDYWKLANGSYIIKMEKDVGLDGDKDVKNTLTSHLGAFILHNSKRILNKFFGEINDFLTMVFFNRYG